MDEVSNSELRDLLKELINSLNENTEINRELLKSNNKETHDIHKLFEVELSAEQQWKDFGLNILANVISNSVDSPKIIKIR